VRRGLQDFIDLHSYLGRNGIKVPRLPISNNNDSTSPAELARPLADYLNKIIREAIENSNFWNLPSLLLFLDDGYNHSLLGSLHLENLNGRVRQLELIQERSDYRTDELTQCLQMILGRLTNMESSPTDSSTQLTENNLRKVTAKAMEKLISPRGLTRLSIASGRTNDSGRSVSIASNSFELEFPSRRESRMTDTSEPSETGAFSDDGLAAHAELTAAAIARLSSDDADLDNRGLARTTSVSKLFSSVNYVSQGSEDEGILDTDTRAMAAALGVPPISTIGNNNASSRVTSYNSQGSDYSIFPQDAQGHGQLQLISLFKEQGLSEGNVSMMLGSGSLSLLAPSTTNGSSDAASLSTTLQQSSNSSISQLFNLFGEHVIAVNSLIAMINPHDEQRSHRNSVRAVVARQIRRAVSAKVIEVGLHALDCFLPDDVLRLCPVLWRSNSINWQTTLLEKLTRLMENPSEVNESSPEDDDCKSIADISDNPAYKVTADHVVSGALLTSVSGESQVQVGIDSVHVEVVPFQKMDQLLLALVEDVSLLVGQQNLFKRSLTIIRAWWVYETTSYIGCAMKHYLSDLTVAVMVCAVFNQFHAVITEPFHALYLFLLTYAEIDWRNCAVSINGIATFQSDLDLTPTVSVPSNFNPLISATLLVKYSAALQSPPSSQRNSGAMSTSAEASTPSSVGTIGDGIIGAPSPIGRVDSPAKSLMSTAVNVSVSGSVDMTAVHPTGWANFELFERREINIINPVDNSNMVTDKLNTRRAKRIIKVFQMGARNLQVAIRTALSGANGAPLSSPVSPSVLTPMNGFFKGICNRFESGWRPDAPNNSLEKLEDPKLSKRMGVKKTSAVVHQLK
jgi:hypothetical protein